IPHVFVWINLLSFDFLKEESFVEVFINNFEKARNMLYLIIIKIVKAIRQEGDVLNKTWIFPKILIIKAKASTINIINPTQRLKKCGLTRTIAADKSCNHSFL